MKADHTQVTRLLKTARGQIDGILKMVEEDRYCLEVSSQIMAAQSILKKANRMLDLVSLKKHKKHLPNQMSGGQQQRVLLARALCATRKILLLDEPVSGLDPQMTEEMYRLIEKINREDKITIIMISHDIRGAMEYASHILQIGQEVIFESKENYLRAHTKRRTLENTGGKK